MRATMVTDAGHPGRANEDFTAALPDAAILIDGAGIPGGESTCHHGITWYATHLGAALLSRLTLGHPLPAALADAIDQVTHSHRDSCAVADPISPGLDQALANLNQPMKTGAHKHEKSARRHLRRAPKSEEIASPPSADDAVEDDSAPEPSE